MLKNKATAKWLIPLVFFSTHRKGSLVRISEKPDLSVFSGIANSSLRALALRGNGLGAAVPEKTASRGVVAVRDRNNRCAHKAFYTDVKYMQV